MVVAGVALAIAAVIIARRLPEHRAADPCEAHPATYACAVFAQPDWLKRRVYAGRLEDRSPEARAPAANIEAVAVSTGGPVQFAVDGI